MARKLHARGRWWPAFRAHLARRWDLYLYWAMGFVSWQAGLTFRDRLVVLVAMLGTECAVRHFVVRPLRAALERRYAEGVRQGRIAMFGEIARHLVTHDPQALSRLESSQREGMIEV
jgi:hypothetical protein